MTQPVFVCPLEPSLLARLEGRSATVAAATPEQVDHAFTLCEENRITLTAVRYLAGGALSEIALDEHWRGRPIAVYADEPGRFRSLRPRLAQLASMSAYVYFSSASENNLTAARMLSSLGIAVTVPLDQSLTNWDLMSDLATYALVGRAPHAPIQPFAYLADSYKPNAWTDYSAVYFNAPARYIHVDSQGRAALSAQDLVEKRFVSDDALAYVDSGAWGDAVGPLALHAGEFSTMSPCTTCSAWRLCLGTLGPREGCSAFAAELMDTLEQAQTQRKSRAVLWQH